MSEVWSRWTGHVVNGTFPLRRYLGASDHSGVFLTEFAGREPHEVAIKLVRAIPTLVDSHGAQWEAAAELANPHLVQLLEAGQCQLDGLPYLYLVMEYADQTLAQLLEHRAMAQEEAREMLLPILDTLAFLHNRNMVQGQLKPANILVIGDTLKLASDTIRSVSDATASINMVSVYDPPEVHDGSVSTAGDMWALGITLFEALTRSPPIGMDARRDGIILPPDFSPMFRDIVRACLSRRPYDRPKAAELAARMRGQSLESGADATGAVASDQTGDGPADAARSVSKPADGFASDAVSELESGSQSATGAALEVDGREGDGARDFGSQAASGFDTHSGESALPPPGAEGSAPEANATPRPPSAASLAVSVLDKLVSILGPGSRASSAASQATAVAPDAGSKETRPLLDLPAATPPKTGEQPKPVAPVGSVAGATNRSGTIVGPGSGAYGAGAPRSVVGSAPEGNGGGHGAGRPAGLTPAGGGASSSRSTGIAGPGSAAMSGSAAASGAAAAFGSPAAVSARGAAGASGASVPEAGTIASRGAPNGATPGAHAPGAGASGTTGQGTTAPGTSALGTHAPGAPAAGSVARSSAGLGSTAPGVGAPGTSTPRGSGPMPGSAGGSAGAGRSGMNPQLDVSGRYRAVPPSAGAPAAAGGGGNGSVTATDASGRYRSVPGASPSGPGVGGAPGVAGGPGGSAGAVDASGRYRSVPGASPPASGVGTAPGVAGGPGGPGGSAGAIDASGRYRSMPGASPSGPGVGATPGSAAGATDASGRYRSVPGASASGVGTAPGGAGGPGAAAGAIDASGRYRSVP
ncbi:MAG TPA: protein kinase, partial [Steroidobacteraceae bacterium]